VLDGQVTDQGAELSLLDAKDSFEIRLHGRGGQGGVTCAKILAAAYARLGRWVQTFGDYAGERSGAPLRAYTRVSTQRITNRNKVYEPDEILVLDPSLLGADTVEGLRAGASVLLNSPQDAASYNGKLAPFQVATVDATAIARRRGIGSRSVVIVNTTIAGAYARIHGLDLGLLHATFDQLGLGNDFVAAQEAYEAVVTRPPLTPDIASTTRTKLVVLSRAQQPVRALTQHVSSGATGLLTGQWSSQRPRYVDNLAPCNAWCPAGNDVVGFIQAAATQGEQAAAAVLGKSTPLAATCGRVCPAPCMDGCSRGAYDGSVNIRALERWTADHSPVAMRPAQRAASAKHVAIVGGGPAGLAAAYEITQRGHLATMYEREAQLGGVLRVGIPSYRLPREVLDREIRGIVECGVQVRCGVSLDADDVAQLQRNHDAVIVATGLQRPIRPDIPGSDLGGIDSGTTFLRLLSLGDAPRFEGRVVVLGGGNTAMDCARSARRAGAREVIVACREGREQMPAIREEIEEAEEEGIILMTLRQPTRFFGDQRIEGVQLAEVEWPRQQGAWPIITERTERIDCDQVIIAFGQSADLGILPSSWQLRNDRFWQDDEALLVFGAGDVATSEGTVAHAIGSGRRAAGLAMKALGLEVEPFSRPDKTKAVAASTIRYEHFTPSAPKGDRALGDAQRVESFAEVNRGLTDLSEAQRCFSCGSCTQCDSCMVYCPEGIITRAASGDAAYAVDFDFCKGCGVCVEECPRESMAMVSQ